MPDHDPQKQREELLRKPAQGLLLIHSGIEATLAITMIHSAIYNNGKINPEYEKVLS